MADIAFARDLHMRGVIELHRSHGRALQNHWTLWRALRPGAAGNHHHKKKSKQYCD
jgi:hypothetical protein